MAATSRASWQAELLHVRHSITDRLPAQSKVAKLTGALSNKEERDVKLVKRIEETIKVLMEAVQAVDKAKADKFANDADIFDVKQKLAAAKQECVRKSEDRCIS